MLAAGVLQDNANTTAVVMDGKGYHHVAIS